MSEFSFPNLTHRKRSCLIGPGEQILDQIKTIFYQLDKFGNDTKTFWFRFQNDIGTFVLSFLTILLLIKTKYANIFIVNLRKTEAIISGLKGRVCVYCIFIFKRTSPMRYLYKLRHMYKKMVYLKNELKHFTTLFFGPIVLTKVSSVTVN